MNYFQQTANKIKSFTKRDDLLKYLSILNRSHSSYELAQIRGYM